MVRCVELFSCPDEKYLKALTERERERQTERDREKGRIQSKFNPITQRAPLLTSWCIKLQVVSSLCLSWVISVRLQWVQGAAGLRVGALVAGMD